MEVTEAQKALEILSPLHKDLKTFGLKPDVKGDWYSSGFIDRPPLLNGWHCHYLPPEHQLDDEFERFNDEQDNLDVEHYIVMFEFASRVIKLCKWEYIQDPNDQDITAIESFSYNNSTDTRYIAKLRCFCRIRQIEMENEE